MIWGGLHGLLQVAESLLTRGSKSKKNSKTQISDQNEKKQWSHILGICARTVLTFILVTVAWIFFRADTLSDAWYVISHMFRNCQYFLPYLREGYDFLGLTKLKLLGLLLPVALLAVFDFFYTRMYTGYWNELLLNEKPASPTLSLQHWCSLHRRLPAGQGRRRSDR